MKKLFNRLVAISLLMSSLVYSQEEKKPIAEVASQKQISLEDAIRLTQCYNGAIRSSILTYEQALTQYKITFGAILPTADISYVHNSTSGSKSTDTFNGLLAWTISDTTSEYFNIQRAKCDIESARFDTINTIRNTLLSVFEQYYTVITTKELYEINKDLVQQTRVFLANAKKTIKPEKWAEEFVLLGEGNMANGVTDELSQKAAVTTTRAALRASIGVDQQCELPEILPIDFTDDPQWEMPLKDIISEACKCNPVLNSLRKQICSQELKVREAQITARFKARIEAAHTHDIERLDSRGTSSLMLTVTLPIFSGFVNEETICLNKQILASLRQDLLQAERDLVSGIKSNYQTLMCNIKRMKAAKAAVQANRLNHQAAIDKEMTVYDVDFARDLINIAEANYRDAYYNGVWLTMMKLYAQMGRELPYENINLCCN